MKKLVMFLIASVAVTAVSYAATNTVSSANIVGYVKGLLPPGGQYTLVGVGFTDTDFNKLFGTNVFNSNPYDVNDSDQAIIFDIQKQSYVTYAYLNGAGSLASGWRPFSDFYNAIPTNPSLPSGSAVWLKSKSSASTTNDIVMSGDVVSTNSISINITIGFQLLSYPFSSDIDLNQTSLIANGATGNLDPNAADKVYVWNGTQYQTYAFFKYSGQPSEWRPINNYYAAAPAIPLGFGKGFWYEAKSSFTWTETNKYLSAFKN